MGSAATIQQRARIKDWSAIDLGNAVASVGDAYATYASVFPSNAVDGEFISGLSQTELMDCMNDIGISNKMHQKKLAGEFLKLTGDENVTGSMHGSPLAVTPARQPKVLFPATEFQTPWIPDVGSVQFTPQSVPVADLPNVTSVPAVVAALEMVQASLVVDPDLFHVMALHTLRGLIALVSKSKAHQHAFGATPGGCGGLVFLLATEKARTDLSVAELSLQAVTALIFMGFGDYFLEENYDWSNQKALSAAGAVRAVLDLIAAHVYHGRYSESVASVGMAALRTLCWCNFSNQQAVGSTGGCQLILDVLVEHGRRSPTVTERGFAVIQSLTYNNSDNQRIFGDLGDVQRNSVRYGGKAREETIRAAVDTAHRKLSKQRLSSMRQLVEEYLSPEQKQFMKDLRRSLLQQLDVRLAGCDTKDAKYKNAGRMYELFEDRLKDEDKNAGGSLTRASLLAALSALGIDPALTFATAAQKEVLAILEEVGEGEIIIEDVLALFFDALSLSSGRGVAIAGAAAAGFVNGTISGQGLGAMTVTSTIIGAGNGLRGGSESWVGGDPAGIGAAAAGGAGVTTVSVVLDLLGRHGPSKAGVAEQGLAVMCWMCHDNIANQKAFGDSGGCQIVVDLITIHGATSTGVAEQGALAVWGMTLNNSSTVLNKQRFNELDTRSLLDAIRKHPSCTARAKEWARWALAELPTKLRQSALPSTRSPGGGGGEGRGGGSLVSGARGSPGKATTRSTGLSPEKKSLIARSKSKSPEKRRSP